MILLTREYPIAAACIYAACPFICSLLIKSIFPWVTIFVVLLEPLPAGGFSILLLFSPFVFCMLIFPVLFLLTELTSLTSERILLLTFQLVLFHFFLRLFLRFRFNLVGPEVADTEGALTEASRRLIISIVLLVLGSRLLPCTLNPSLSADGFLLTVFACSLFAFACSNFLV